MSWIVEYMRYHYPGRYEADSLTEAIAVAMSAIDDGRFAPEAILRPDGTVVVDDPSLRRMYSEQWGAISIDEIAAQYGDAANRLGEALG